MGLHNSISTQHLLGSMATAILLGAAMAFTANGLFSRAFLHEQQLRGEGLALHAAEDCVDPLLTRAPVDLAEKMAIHLSTDKDVEYIFVIDSHGDVVYHSFDGGMPTALADVNPAQDVAGVSVQQMDTDRGWVLDLATPILEGRAGKVHVGLSQERVRTRVARTSALIAAIAVLLVALSSMSVVYTSRLVTRPLATLAIAADRVGRGDLSIEVPVEQRNEVGAVAAAFNLMSRRLGSAQASERRHADLQIRINEILRLALDEPSLDRVLQRSLEIVLDAPWLVIEGKGAILLAREDEEVLDLRAHVGLDDAIRCACREVPFGTCICGTAAASEQTQFRAHLDPDHITEYEGMSDHGHYCVPILSGGRVLGVLNTYLVAGHDNDDTETDFLEAIASTLAGVIERHRAEASRREADAERAHLLEAITSILVGLDLERRVTTWNPVAHRLLGIPPSVALGKPITELEIPWDDAPLRQWMVTCTDEGASMRIDDLRYRRPDGNNGVLEANISPVVDESGNRYGCLLVAVDVTEQRELEAQLLLAHKLESVGRLAAGVAHEINTPLQYVGSNIAFLQDVMSDLLTVGDLYGTIVKATKDGVPVARDQHAALVEAWDRLDYAYLSKEVPRAIDQAHTGVRTVSEILRAMRVFSHGGSASGSLVQLNTCIEATITVANSEWKGVARVEQILDPALPLVLCNAAEFNQVMLNLVVNAAHAIGEMNEDGREELGTITVSTRADGDHVDIRVQDTGGGIPEEIADKIYEPFFTTKKVGEGTGQGLSIARSVVVDRLGGTLEFETAVGVGTTFVIRLPVIEGSAEVSP